MRTPIKIVTIFQGGFHLPYSIDFSTLADGPIPSPWVNGGNWAISSGVLYNTPTLGTELLTDPGLEANYTAGLCDTLTKNGSPNLAESADVHGGTKAQQFQATAQNDYITFAPVVGAAATWYKLSRWLKMTSGTSYNLRTRSSQMGALPAPNNDIGGISATYAQNSCAFVSTSTNNILAQLIDLNSSGFPTVITDDYSLTTVTKMAATLPRTKADAVLKLKPQGEWASWVDQTPIGILGRASDSGSTTMPANCIIALLRPRASGPSLGVASLLQKIGSTYTSLISETVVTLVAGGYLELRLSGATASLWYNDAQVGTNQTPDAALLNNGIHGVFSPGGNGIQQFLVQAS